jgi:hypothetical protein
MIFIISQQCLSLTVVETLGQPNCVGKANAHSITLVCGRIVTVEVGHVTGTRTLPIVFTR